jgi:hypothetical protein
MPDEICNSRGIPEHLHRCDRPVVPNFDTNERLFRRFPPACIGNDIANAVSFDKKKSSVNRSKFSGPDDALWVEKTGEYKGAHGVISFPSGVYSGKSWHSNEKNKPVVTARIEQFHDPLQCNYAHTDFRLIESDVDVEKITRPSIKAQLRDLLRPLIKREL